MLPKPETFQEELYLTGAGVAAVPGGVWTFLPLALGLGTVNWAEDTLEEMRPIGGSESMDNFWKYTVKGIGDLAKFIFWGAIVNLDPISSSRLSPSASMSYSSNYGYNGYKGMMGLGSHAPGVNRVAGQY
jgi:hypothetical protein